MADERSYRFAEVDKTGWGAGPWQDEPDKVVWVDDATGLDCMIVRNHVGALCGYVGVPEGHPWFEVDYDDVHEVDVHGDLTFAAHCAPDGSEDQYAICHDDTGRPPNVWWLGFDCAHFMDIVPSVRAWVHFTDSAPSGGEHLVVGSGEYRSLGYVRAEVASLAAQAAAVWANPTGGE